jgi:NAD(P)-dependent dehydrogenase (short-subunit alcohol dehydrogenase family)
MTWDDMKFALFQNWGECGQNLLINLRLRSRYVASPDIRLDGKTVIVTGSNRTIGKAAAEDLSRRGARVILACRNMELAEAAAADIRTRVTNADLVCYNLDLSSLKSIEEFVANVTKQECQIDMLINNAGMLTTIGREKTADGFEMMLGVNCLGTAYLSLLLFSHIQKSSDGRILFVTSLAHTTQKEVRFDDLMSDNMEKDAFSNMDVYAHSKLCLLLFVRRFARLAIKSNVRVYAVDPGVSITDIARDAPLTFKLAMAVLIPYPCMRSVKDAASSVVAPAMLGKDEYRVKEYHFCDGLPTPVSRLAQDDELADKLWQQMNDLLKHPDLMSK